MNRPGYIQWNRPCVRYSMHSSNYANVFFWQCWAVSNCKFLRLSVFWVSRKNNASSNLVHMHAHNALRGFSTSVSTTTLWPPTQRTGRNYFVSTMPAVLFVFIEFPRVFSKCMTYTAGVVWKIPTYKYTSLIIYSD